MNTPSNLKYTSTDEWVLVQGNIATVGVSDFAQSQLSDVVYVEIKVEPGDKLAKNEPLATVESVKAAADVNSPVSGNVLEVNESLSQSPEVVNSDPYSAAWMVKLELSNPGELDSLMDAATYTKFCQEREH